MAKHAFNELWIDGFNLFYKWDRTKHLFGRNCDIKHAQEESLRLLAINLGKKRSRSIVFMDGGLERECLTLHGLRIRYPGSGKKADSLLEEFARAKTSNKRILAVTSDRYLAATLRRNRIQIIDSEKFIKEFLVGQNSTYTYNEIKPEITSTEEMEEWLQIFSDDSEFPDEPFV